MKKKGPLVSILMNCFNSEKFIRKSILSALNQTYKNFELVIWDDASSDNTVKIIKSFKTKKIKFFYNRLHLGLGKSRILAQKFLKGKFIAILDSDDIWEKNKIKIQIREFYEKKKIGFVASWYKLVDDKNKILTYVNKSYDQKNFLKYICKNNIFAHSSIIYSKEYAKKVGWYDDKLEYAQDYDLTVKLLKLYNFKLINNYLVKIRISNNSMSLSKKLQYIIIKEKIIILRKILRLFNLSKFLQFEISKSIFKQEIKYFLLILLNKIVR